jgi:hypothetical protein
MKKKVPYYIVSWPYLVLFEGAQEIDVSSFAVVSLHVGQENGSYHRQQQGFLLFHPKTFGLSPNF